MNTIINYITSSNTNLILFLLVLTVVIFSIATGVSFVLLSNNIQDIKNDNAVFHKHMSKNKQDILWLLRDKISQLEQPDPEKPTLKPALELPNNIYDYTKQEWNGVDIVLCIVCKAENFIFIDSVFGYTSSKCSVCKAALPKEK